MATRNWGFIGSGTTFEALATTLVFFEDPTAALFGRRGVDGGQDARSGDGTRVFQAKHHIVAAAAKAIADAKNEAEKISRYRQPSHPRNDQWKSVTHWRLVTNADFNPTDHQTWITDVMPLFAKVGLIADYWERITLDSLLDRHVEVDRSFFKNEARTFLSVPEVRERLLENEPFLQRDRLGEFRGRDAERAAVRSFLQSSHLFLLVHGPGGVGKTRLVVEVGEEIAGEGHWQVLWANTATMAASSAWFEGIVPERPTLLLVDEPEDEQTLRVLSEQLGGRVGRASKWKIAVSVRSPKDPVLRFLFAPKLKPRVEELKVGAVSATDAEAICFDLLTTGKLSTRAEQWRREVASALAKRFSRYPIWMTLAVHLLEAHGDLAKVPESAEGLADLYLNEVIDQKQFPREQVLALLRWISLIGTYNRSDGSATKLLSEGTGIADEARVGQQVAALIDRRALSERGAGNRLVELKPDVLRDHILLNWLSVRVGGPTPVVPSKDAKDLASVMLDALVKGTISSHGRAVLASLARTEKLLEISGTPVPLLDPIFQGIKLAIATATASQRLLFAEILIDVAAFHPLQTVALSRELRRTTVAAEKVKGLIREKEVSQDSIVLELAWPMFHAAIGASGPEETKVVLNELCSLVQSEAEIKARTGSLPNDGKRAESLVERVVQGGPQFFDDYEVVAGAMARDLLKQIATQEHDRAVETSAAALIEPLLSVERRQTWSDDFTLHFQTRLIAPGMTEWTIRDSIREQIKNILADKNSRQGLRALLWPLLVSAHRSANQARIHGSNRALTDENLSDLQWALLVLKQRAGDLRELVVARDLWEWHFRFEENPDIKNAAILLEELYSKHDLTSEFGPLVAVDWEEQKKNSRAKAAALAASNLGEIENFLDRAAEFLGAENGLRQLAPLAWFLGELAPQSASVREFVAQGLKEKTLNAKIDLRLHSAVAWIAELRTGKDPASAAQLVAELTTECIDDERRADFIGRVYGAVPPRKDVGTMTELEHSHLRGLSNLFLAVNRGPAFVQSVSWTIFHNWTELRQLIENVMSLLPESQIESALATLVDGVYWALHLDKQKRPEGLGVWLLDQLVRLPDMDRLNSHAEWHVNEIIKELGPAPLSWLPNALQRRIEVETNNGDRKFRSLGHDAKIGRYVVHVSAANSSDGAIQSAVKDLLDLHSNRGSVGYALPNLLRTVDPAGLLVPNEVASRIATAENQDAAYRIARLAEVYAVGGQPWRAVAKAILTWAERGPPADRKRVYGTLLGRGSRSWSGTPGQVPALFNEAVKTAQEQLDKETDPALVPFWRWNLDVAKAELEEQEGIAKEERGE